MNFKNLLFVYVTAIILLLTNCEKPEGLGGNSSIIGKVTVKAYDESFTTLQDTYAASDENVFLKLVNEDYILDETSTSHDGLFQFNYLTEGKYSIIVYADTINSTSSNDETPIIKQVEINDKKKEIDAGEIFIYKTLDYDDGHATISGTVYQVNWTKDFIVILDTTKAQEQDIYLFYQGDKQFVDRIRTNQDGYFEFNNLIKGNYKVLVYSEDTLSGFELIPIINEIEITEIDENKSIGNIFAAKED